MTSIKKKKKMKYWYRTDIYACVLCGKETKYKYRIDIEKEKGIHWHDTACDRHFL